MYDMVPTLPRPPQRTRAEESEASNGEGRTGEALVHAACDSHRQGAKVRIGRQEMMRTSPGLFR